MSLHLIYDDITEPPVEIRSLVGVPRFSDLVFQRQTRAHAMRDIAIAADANLIHFTAASDVDAFLARLSDEDSNAVFMVAPSNLIPRTSLDNLVVFLNQSKLSPCELHMPLEGGRQTDGWTLLRAPLLRHYLQKRRDGLLWEFFESYGDLLVDVPSRIPLINVNDERSLLDYLSGQLDARHFNAVVREDYTITKRSANREKIRREYEFYKLAPPELQMFLVQPFDFQDDGETASYRMERLSVPDVAMQWVQGAFQADEYRRFLRHIFYFISTRPQKRVARSDAAAAQDKLYVDKVKRRISELKAMPGYQDLAPLLQAGCGGIDALLERYLALFAKHRHKLPSDSLTIGHGDPCFSNILYSKINQSLKLIDPNGALTAEDLYTDAYYDVAKLSHSALGQYDFINQGKFDISVGQDLRPQVSFLPPPPSWAAPSFTAELAAANFDLFTVRLCEASLFLSMLPLHMDRPQKVLAFAIRGADILDNLHNGRMVW